MTLILSGTNGLSDVDGDASTPAVRGTDANSGIFFGADQVGVSTNGVERVEFGNSETVFNDGGADVDFRVEGDTNAYLLFVDASTDFVGIGTNAPAARLHSETGLSSPALILQANTAATSSSGTGTTIRFRGNANAGSPWEIFRDNDVTGDLVVAQDVTGTRTERMRIDASGNLLVGTTSALGKITSSSSFNPDGGTWDTTAAVSTTGSFGGGLALIEGSAGYGLYCADSGNDFYIRGSNSLSTALTGGVYINDRATSWSAASDERLKTIIEPITDAINKVCQLRTVIGRYNNEAEGKRHPFLIAQDVQMVLPEAVSVADKQSEEQYLGVSYTDTIPLLVAAIKEQQALITALTARITALETA
jgi:hypothetical protein